MPSINTREVGLDYYLTSTSIRLHLRDNGPVAGGETCVEQEKYLNRRHTHVRASARRYELSLENGPY
jgi:hypothetical protein